MTILIDNRVGSKELAPLLTKLHAPNTLTRLPYADFCFTGNGPETVYSIGIERKTVSDLLQSMSSGRLSGHQLHGLLNHYHVVYILIEGLWRACPNTGIIEHYRRGKWQPLSYNGTRQYMARELHNYLNTLSIMCGCLSWQTGTPQQSAKWLLDIYSWWSKKWDAHQSHLQYKLPDQQVSFRKPTLLHRVAKEFAGVGWKRGLAISQHFGSVEKFVMAGVEGVAGVKGVSKLLAGKIKDEMTKG